MSDEFLAEVKEDIERERFLRIIKKYWIYALIIVGLILGGVYLYKYQKNAAERYAQQQSDIFHRKSEAIASGKPLDLEGLDPSYHPLLVNQKYRLLIEESKQTEAEALIAEFLDNNPYNLVGDVPDYAHSFMMINHLGAIYDKTDLETYEDMIKNYARLDGAFSARAYELLVVKSLDSQNFDKAEYYIEFLDNQKGSEPGLEKRIKAYRDVLAQNL